MKFNFFGGEDASKQFSNQLQRAADLSNAHKYKDALPAHEKCLTIAAQGELILTAEQLFNIWINISTCYFQLDDYDAVLRYCRGMLSLLGEWMEAHEPGKDAAAELRKNKSVPDWTGLIPKGVKFMFNESFDAWPALAYTNKTAGSASIYAKQYEQGMTYYKKAIGAYQYMKLPNETAEIWTYVANEFQRREEFDMTEKAARKALELARRGGKMPIQMNAGFLLVHTYIALGMFIQALEQLEWMIPLGTKIRDPKTASLTKTLGWISDKIHATAGAALEPAPLGALIRIERALGYPENKADFELLVKIEMVLALRAKAPRDNIVRSLSDIKDVLKAFAEKHCGPQIDGQHPWSLGTEEIMMYDKKSYIGKAVGVMLYLNRSPETFIRVTLDTDVCLVTIMKAKKIPLADNKFTTGYIGLEPRTVPAQVDALLQFLDEYIVAGTLMKQDGRLVYVDPPEKK